VVGLLIYNELKIIRIKAVIGIIRVRPCYAALLWKYCWRPQRTC